MTGSGKPMLVLVGGRTLAFFATFLTPVILVRIFDQRTFGTYKQFFLLWTTFYALGQFGMAESLFYFVPRTPARVGRYVANSVLFLTLSGLVGLALLRFGGNSVSSWLGNTGLAAYTGLTGLFLTLTMATAVLEIVMMTREQYVLAAMTYGFSDVLRAASFVIPAILLHRLEWVFVGAVAFAALRLCAALVYLGREIGSGLRPDLSAFGEQLRYVVPFGTAVLVDVAQLNFHQYVVSNLFGAAAFAVYSVGCLNIPLVDLVTGPASNVMMVRMAEALANGREALPLWHDTTRKLALLLVPLVTFVLLTGRDFIEVLFTDSYIGSVPIFMIWSIGILWMSLNTDGVLRVYADTRFMLALSVLRLGLNALLIFWLLGVLRTPGAALATILAAGIAKLVALERIRRLMGATWARLLPWRSLATITGASAAAALPVLLLRAQPGIAPLSFLLVSGPLYGVALVGFLIRFHLLTEDERLAISSWVQKAGGALHAALPAPEP